MTWDPALDELENVLAEIYPRKEDCYRLVDRSGLESKRIAFSDRAIDNWHNILLEAKISNKVQGLIEFTLSDSNMTKGVGCSNPAECRPVACQPQAIISLAVRKN
jgi:hypothetical protein